MDTTSSEVEDESTARTAERFDDLLDECRQRAEVVRRAIESSTTFPNQEDKRGSRYDLALAHATLKAAQETLDAKTAIKLYEVAINHLRAGIAKWEVEEQGGEMPKRNAK